eukprot:6695868-Pyramimonas_sp.AAC.1
MISSPGKVSPSAFVIVGICLTTADSAALGAPWSGCLVLGVRGLAEGALESGRPSGAPLLVGSGAFPLPLPPPFQSAPFSYAALNSASVRGPPFRSRAAWPCIRRQRLRRPRGPQRAPGGPVYCRPPARRARGRLSLLTQVVAAPRRVRRARRWPGWLLRQALDHAALLDWVLQP